MTAGWKETSTSFDHSTVDLYKMAKESNNSTELHPAFRPFANLLQTGNNDKEQKMLEDMKKKEADQKERMQKKSEARKQKMLKAEEMISTMNLQRRSPLGSPNHSPVSSTYEQKPLAPPPISIGKSCDIPHLHDKSRRRRVTVLSDKQNHPSPRRQSLIATFRSKSLRVIEATVEKEDNGDEFYAKGKAKAEERCWKDAILFYNAALKRQRKIYGEDSLICSRTLNDVGVALRMFGETFMALQALEEALSIRQAMLGTGAQEVAETTNNICLALKDFKDKEAESNRDGTFHDIKIC